MGKTSLQKERYRVLTRREFLTRPFVWIMKKPVLSKQSKPVSYRIPLSALKHIPETDLMCMTPTLRHGWTVRFCESGIAYRGESGQEGMVSIGSECCLAARFFDGTRTLEQVVSALATELGITKNRSASIVREAFITLSESEVYHPNDPPGPIPTGTPPEHKHA